MKHLYTLLLFAAIGHSSVAQTLCENGFAGEFPCNRVDIWSTLSLGDLNEDVNTNDIWGWTHEETGREFAIVGLRGGTAFVDVTNPSSPVVIGNLPTHTTGSLWRDIKVFNDHAFIVSEASDHGMQVFDLNQLIGSESPVTFESTAHYDGFGNAHNIVINEETGFAYAVGTQTFQGGLHIVDINDPLNPVIAGGFEEDGYTHDAQAVIYRGPDEDYCGREIVFAANEDTFTIVDVEDKDDCQLIAAGGYPTNAYAHQGWLSEDHRYFFLNDELDELQQLTTQTATYVWDIQDLDNPQLIFTYEGEATSIDHNYYARWEMLFQSNYRSGLRILDISATENQSISEIGFVDTQPADDITQFSGSWSNYCYFPSGTVVLTDMYTGLFIVRPRVSTADYRVTAFGAQDELTFNTYLSYSPDAHNVTFSNLPAGVAATPGAVNFPGPQEIILSGVSSLSAGDYTFTVELTHDGLSDAHEVTLTVSDESGESIEAATPSGVIDTVDPIFEWNSTLTSANYTLQVSTDEAFTDIIFEDETNQTMLELPVSLPEGEYFWRVIAEDICGTSYASDTGSFGILIVSVDEQARNEMRVYPNPATDQLNVVLSGKSGTIIELFNAAGQRVAAHTFSGAELTQIDISTLEPGMYLIGNGQGVVRRFAVVK